MLWHDDRVQAIQISSGSALRYRSGQPPLPIRWVLVRRHDQPPRAFFSTCPDDRAEDIVSAYIQRWSIETTFEESRARLGFETQRQWSDLATERTTPCLLGLYSIVVLLAYRLYQSGGLSVRRLAWYNKQQATFSNALAAVRYHLWEVEHFSTSPAQHRVRGNSSRVAAVLAAAGLLYPLTPVESCTKSSLQDVFVMA